MSSRSAVAAIRRHRVPAWWSDAKLGIFVHWTPASVPAFAPVDAEIGELLARRDPHALAWSPYSEWYENSMRFPDSPAARHHREVYGDRPFSSFAADWEAGLDGWDPDGWAASFAATGARYVVLVTKHMDGFCLWPTDVPNPHRPGYHSSRDVVGELADAVRARGLRFGVYYSGGLDATFNDHPIGAFSDLLAAQPRGDYVAYAEAHVRELIDRYRPSVLWNDISWPAPAPRLAGLLAEYYAAVPDGVINDRFMPWSLLWEAAKSRPARALLDRASSRGAKADKGIVPPKPPMFDVRTPEYTVFDSVQPTPWECVRGMDLSFGHNRLSEERHFLTRRDLLWSLVDITATGGNLLLNVGPRGEDATIPDAQLRRLGWLGELTEPCGPALFASRPWVHPQGRSTCDGRTVDVRYTARDASVFAFLRLADETGAEPGDRATVVLAQVDACASTAVRTLDGRVLRHEATDAGLAVALDRPLSAEDPLVVVLDHVAAR
ncbi:MAG TPA: alpha-L-fucosidase [Mycobacteriales bacterium]